jgi:multiple sugar transport system permease protein
MSELSQPRTDLAPVRRSSGLFGIDLASPRHASKLGYLLLAPAALLILAILVYPMLLAIDISFHDVKFATLSFGASEYTLANYQKLFSSPDFWKAIGVTAQLLVVVTSISMAVGLGTALLVNNRFKGQALARLLIALPWAIPEVIAVVIFAWLFDSSFGVMNWLFIRLGLVDQTINWFSSPMPRFAVVTTVMVWKGYPFVSIMMLAGLQSIPEDFYNAAKVDGARAWQRLLYITIPSLMPVIGVTLMLVMLWVFRDFSIIYVLTGGGPLKATQSLSIMTYEQAFGFFKMGYASAIGVITLIVCVIASRLMIARALSEEAKRPATIY